MCVDLLAVIIDLVRDEQRFETARLGDRLEDGVCCVFLCPLAMVLHRHHDEACSPLSVARKGDGSQFQDSQRTRAQIGVGAW
jgi:hypothetical protein